MASSVRIKLKGGIKKFKDRIDKEEVYQAWLSGNYARVFDAVPWEQMPGDLEGYSEALLDAAGKSSLIAIEALPAPVIETLRYDTKNPDIKNLINDSTGRLVENIKEGTREFIADAVSRRFDEALSPRRVADIIKPSIGLNSRQVIALNNYRNMLEKKETPDSRIETLTDAYYDRLLDYRSVMIARTESQFAMNQGQLSVWKEATDQGLIDPTAKKRWVVDGNPCPQCEDLGEQEPIELDDSWDSEGDTVDSPPLHPNCYCNMELVFEKAEEGGLESEGETEA